MDYNQNLKKIFTRLPNKPGIYKYLDVEGTVIYVGKAKDLKKRVKSYFLENKDHGPKIRVLVSKIDDIEFIEVDSELEAIMLETNLIKELKPKYNVLMKDDKNFIYIKITTNEEFPRIYLTRKILKDKATYFGPKTSGFDVKNSIKLISSLLPYPKCQINVELAKDGFITKNQKLKSPCIFKQIDPNHTPCISDLNPQEYREIINIIIEFFKGKHTHIIKIIEQKMQEFAVNKDFEKAAIMRDRLQSLIKTIEKQKINNPTQEDCDVIDVIFDSNQYFSNIFQVREGKLISQENFILPATNLIQNIDEALKEALTNFIKLYYSNTQDIPKTILIAENLTEQKNIETWLTHEKGSSVKVEVPQIGRKNDLIALATKNAEQYAKLMRVKWMNSNHHESNETLNNLKTILNLKKAPKRIECYDISHLQGTETVGSMVVFENGLPSKENYRIFNIKELEKGDINDFDSLFEVVKRRLKYLACLPDKYIVKKKNNCLTLLQQKKELGLITFTEHENQTISLELTNLKDTPPELIEGFLQCSIQKLKAKRYLLNTTDKDLIDIITQIGFITINNKNFNYGYYTQKQIYDQSFITKPDLIIIDGGKGQLSATLKAKKLYKCNIPFISIAKKNEELFTEDKQKIILPFNSPTLNLIQQLRNEAHRFAITKNRKDRIKRMTQ